MRPSGPIRAHMGPHGSMWAPTRTGPRVTFVQADTVDGIIKVPQGPYGPHMGPYGPCGTLIIPSSV